MAILLVDSRKLRVAKPRNILKTFRHLKSRKILKQRSQGFYVAPSVKAKRRGDSMSRILYTPLYEFGFVYICVRV